MLLAARAAGDSDTRQDSMSRCAIEIATAKLTWTMRTAGSATSVWLTGAAGMQRCSPRAPNPAWVLFAHTTCANWQPSGKELVDGVHDGPARQLGAPAQARLVADPREVVLHRARGHVDLLGDLAVREALGDQPEDLELARRELVVQVLRLASGGALVLLEQVPGEVRRDDRPAAVHGDDRLAQLLPARALRDVAGGARGDRGEQRLGLLARRHDEGTGLRHLLAQALEHHHAAHLGHVEVQEDDVGAQVASHLEPFPAVARLADDVDAGIAAERGRHALADQREVVDEQDADVHAANSSAASASLSVTRVPAPGMDSTNALPPSRSTRPPMLWRMPRPRRTEAGSNPVPSSSTTMPSVSPDTEQRTTAESAPACRAALTSASRTAPASASAAWAGTVSAAGPTTRRMLISPETTPASRTASASARPRSRGPQPGSTPSTKERS